VLAQHGSREARSRARPKCGFAAPALGQRGLPLQQLLVLARSRTTLLSTVSRMEPAPIIPCVERHLPAVLEIWNDAIVNSTAIYDYEPRTPVMVKYWFEQKRQAHRPVIGIESAEGTLIAFATYGAFRPFPAYKYTVEHSVYVTKSHRGQGHGKRLMLALIAAAQAQNLHVLVGAIDSANTESVSLHRTMGFQPCGTVKQAAYKFNRWLDLEFYQLILRTPEKPVEG
jgi:L-amino acid N-acyltransferase